MHISTPTHVEQVNPADLHRQIDQLAFQFHQYHPTDEKIISLFNQLVPLLKQLGIWCIQPNYTLDIWRNLTLGLTHLLDKIQLYLLGDLCQQEEVRKTRMETYHDFTLALKHPNLQIPCLENQLEYYLPTICVVEFLPSTYKTYLHSLPFISTSVLFKPPAPIPFGFLEILFKDTHPFTQDPFVVLIKTIFCSLIKNSSKGLELFNLFCKIPVSEETFLKLINDPKLSPHIPPTLCLKIAEQAFIKKHAHVSNAFARAYHSFLLKNPPDWSQTFFTNCFKHKIFYNHFMLAILLTRQIINFSIQDSGFLKFMQESPQENQTEFSFGSDYSLNDLEFLFSHFSHLKRLTFKESPLKESHFFALSAFSLEVLSFTHIAFPSTYLLYLPSSLQKLFILYNPDQELKEEFGKRLPPNLTHLTLCGTYVELRPQELFSESLHISLTRLTLKQALCPDGFFGGALTQFTHLADLWIYNTSITDDLAHYLPSSLIDLMLEECSSITEKFFQIIHQNINKFPKLSQINLRMVNISPQAIAPALQKIVHLR